MDTYIVIVHSWVLHIIIFCVSVAGNRFEQVGNRSMNKLSEKYEVHGCIKIKDLELFLLVLLNLHTGKLRKAFDKYLHGNKILLVF